MKIRKKQLWWDLKSQIHPIRVTTMHTLVMKMKHGTHLLSPHNCNTPCLATQRLQILLKLYLCLRMQSSITFILRIERPRILWWRWGLLIASIRNLSQLCYTNLFKGGAVPALSVHIEAFIILGFFASIDGLNCNRQP